MKRLLALFAVLTLALAAGRFAAAMPQSHGTATLSGVVIGPDDKPAPHASVSYQVSDGSGPHAVFADAHGRFTITHLRANNYDIRASDNGVFSEWEKNVALRRGQSKSIELRLIYAREMPKPASSSTKKH
jgi:hypothetical protein